jgi:hypothetical protein
MAARLCRRCLVSASVQRLATVWAELFLALSSVQATYQGVNVAVALGGSAGLVHPRAVRVQAHVMGVLISLLCGCASCACATTCPRALARAEVSSYGGKRCAFCRVSHLARATCLLARI